VFMLRGSHVYKFGGKGMKKLNSVECSRREVMFNKYSNSLVGRGGE
jgi:hypothetical protein